MDQWAARAADSSALDYPDLKRQLAISLERIGDVLIVLDRTEDALRAHDAILKLFESDQSRTDLSNDFAAVNQKLGRMYNTLGDPKSALRYFVRALEVSTQLARENATRTDLQLEALKSRIAFAEALVRDGQTMAALQQLRETVHIYVRTAQAGIEWDRLGYDAFLALGRLLAATDSDRGLAQLREARSIARRIAITTGKDSRFDLKLAFVATQEADALIELGDPAGALAVSEAVVGDIRSLVARKAASEAALAQGLGNLAWYAIIANQSARALQATDEAIELAGDTHWIQISRGHALLALGSRREAMEQYKRIAPNQRRDGKKWSDEIIHHLVRLKGSGVAIEALSDGERLDIARVELEASHGK